MYKLISGENAAKKKNSIKWDSECQEAFDKLKELCTTTQILACADLENPSNYTLMQVFEVWEQFYISY